ncbi:MAG: DUF2461 domain-containing protein [Myxococcales bacterium]|nr:MAG: DUF2461 domain-containing protein [Myxococcales bacterium]
MKQEPIGPFRGFPKEAVQFFVDLTAHNDKKWFEAHKTDYETFVLQPAKAFVAAVGVRLSKYAPDIQAIPSTNGSIFRIYRDTRFSKDKSPYKTHLGILWWEGPREKMESPSFYFQLEPPTIGLGGGVYCFSKPLLEAYREAVVHPKAGKELVKAAEKTKKEGFALGGEKYKKTPRGYDPAHSNAPYLLHDGLYAWHEEKISKAVHGPEFVDLVVERFKGMLPLHRWLLEMVKGIGG